MGPIKRPRGRPRLKGKPEKKKEMVILRKNFAEVTFGQIRAPNFNPLLQKLMSTPMSLEFAEKFKLLVDEIIKEQKRSDQVWKSLSAQYLEPINVNDPQSQVIIKSEFDEDQRMRIQIEISNFMIHKVTLSATKLPRAMFEEIKLSPEEYAGLHGLIA